MDPRGLFPHRKVVEVLTRNSIFQQLESLQRNRQKRYRLGLSIIEGVRLTDAARRFRVPVEAFVYDREKRLSRWARNVLQSDEAECLLGLSSALFRDLSRRSDVPELMAVIRTPEDHLSRIVLSELPLLLILDRPSSPGNIGAAIRSAEALGVDGVIIFGHAADLYSPEALAASMGSMFAVPAVRVKDGCTLLQWVNRCRLQFPNIRLIGADERAGTVLAGCDLTQPTIFVVGNEARGVSTTLNRACDVKTRIPMTGFATSFNAACATSICMYEAVRQRSQTRLT